MIGSPESLWVLGARVDRVGRYEAMSLVSDMMETPGLSQVVTLNPEYVMMARRHPDLLRIINCAGLSVADGAGIVWATRLEEKPLRDRVTGTDLLPEICRLAAHRGHGVFFLGGKPGVAGQAAARLKSRFPDLVVAGSSSNDPCAELDSRTLEEIRRSGARVLAVAYGCPKQDFWIDQHREELPGVRLAIGVGGAFDFISGETPRAPGWMRHAGLEWLFRLWMEPRRLRRMLALPGFAALVAAQAARRPKNRPG
ncbi:MAG: WecB/TagA/CpsF family glycosyltransferase [Thermoleophilia bacterium]|nr:WecB/TagA/CpsF family glycosyltransferase [Thermoleophilia bacterium]